MELGLKYQPHLWPTVSPNGEGFFSQLLNGVRLRKKRGNLDQIPSLSLSCCPSQSASPPFPGPSRGSILNASMGSRALWPQMPLSHRGGLAGEGLEEEDQDESIFPGPPSVLPSRPPGGSMEGPSRAPSAPARPGCCALPAPSSALHPAHTFLNRACIKSPELS